MDYKDGQIITDHTAFANWTNSHGNQFYDTANGDGTYTVHKIPETTPEELQTRVRGIRNNMLDETDKYMISDFPLPDEQRHQMKLYRQYLRDYTQQENWWEQTLFTFDEWETKE